MEGLSELVKSGKLKNCEFINVESEFAALSVAIGASGAGARAYTATSSQGLLFMMEAVYNVSGLGLPIVMTLGTRAIGAPINIWNDHSDAMSVRDAGWIMLFAETNQEATDLHLQAFKIAEKLSCPVMVCVDGFILTHAFEQVDIPDQREVDSFLRPSNRSRCWIRLIPFPSEQWLDRTRSRKFGTWRTTNRSRHSRSFRRLRWSSRRGSAETQAASSDHIARAMRKR